MFKKYYVGSEKFLILKINKQCYIYFYMFQANSVFIYKNKINKRFLKKK